MGKHFYFVFVDLWMATVITLHISSQGFIISAGCAAQKKGIILMCFTEKREQFDKNVVQAHDLRAIVGFKLNISCAYP